MPAGDEDQRVSGSDEGEVRNVVLLHGFAGTAHTFDGVISALRADPLAGERYRPFALDLPGHGVHADWQEPITFNACVKHVLAQAPSRFALCGYSMGGRIALHIALTAPARVSRLVLVSTSAGIERAVDRQARIASDERLAADIEGGSLEDFIDRWRGQPLFASEPPHVRALAVAEHRRNRAGGLAAALRGIGTGRMKPLWDRLAEIEIPVAILAGERDEKYIALGERLASAPPHATLHVVAGGHSLALENPAAVAAAICEPH